MNISAGTGNIWTLGRSSWNWATKQGASMCAFLRATHRRRFGLRFVSEVARITRVVLPRRGLLIHRRIDVTDFPLALFCFRG